MNTKVAVIMLLLIVISSTALLMESNQVYAPVHKENGFGNSTILYHNSTYIMGKMDGLYFTDIYNNGWHYTILNSAPAINSSISDAVISDKIVSDLTSNNNVANVTIVNEKNCLEILYANIENIMVSTEYHT